MEISLNCIFVLFCFGLKVLFKSHVFAGPCICSLYIYTGFVHSSFSLNFLYLFYRLLIIQGVPARMDVILNCLQEYYVCRIFLVLMGLRLGRG